jgi:poly(glycerol-phosphate) alpha-glucosyltransferase
VSSIELPPGRHYAVTWSIPDDYAGMTNSLLHRSRALVREAGAEVTILTYAHRDDYDATRDRLIERKAMIEGMHLRNLWEDVRTWDDVQLKAATSTFAKGPDEFEPLGDRGDHSSPFAHVLRDDQGNVIQADYFRADGSLLASDQHPSATNLRRSVVLCDTSGAPLGLWRGPWNLYYLWLDSLPRDPTAWMICDSKSVATHLTTYHRPDVVTIHVVRGSHLRAGTGRPQGELNPRRKFVMENLRSWDAVVFLTNEQRRDVEALMGPHDNLHVIPNNRPVPAEVPNLRRNRTKGVMLASLTTRKQIGQAVRAISKVGRVRGRRVRLEVWGKGEREEPLRRYIAKVDAAVTLRGHSSTAIDEFEKASFSLLTSKSEAFANVLIESMGRGCIPISYETPYGPSDIITHGVDGFLVPQDDVAALAKQIRAAVAAKPTTLAAMRLAGHRRALQFTDFTDRWAVLMHSIAAARRDRVGNVEA